MEAPRPRWLHQLLLEAAVILLREKLRKANKPGRIRLDNVTVRELTQPPEEFPMAVQTLAFDVSGDAPFGYVLGEAPGKPISYDNRAGMPMDPPPPLADIEGGTAPPDAGSITPLSGGRAWIKVVDTMPVGTVAVHTLSFVKGTTTDDAVITVTYVADRPGVVNMDGVTFAEATAEPAP